MNLILLGAPGAGKGTQGKRLAERLSVPTIATGDLLRAAVRNATPLGLQAKEYMDRGALVPDGIILGLIEEVLASAEAAGGVIMDGFPRTTAQADAVERLLARRGAAIDQVLNFRVPEAELTKRLLGRAAQEGRSDDTPETIGRRLAVYREQTKPLVAYYRERGLLKDVDATGTVEAITERALAAVGQ